MFVAKKICFGDPVSNGNLPLKMNWDIQMVLNLSVSQLPYNEAREVEERPNST